jgi:hypothetical protein
MHLRQVPNRTNQTTENELHVRFEYREKSYIQADLPNADFNKHKLCFDILKLIVKFLVS